MSIETQNLIKLAVPTKNGTRFIAEEDILYCKASGSYTEIFVIQESSFLITKGLSKLHQAFLPGTFARIHHSHIVNLSYIIGYALDGENTVTLSNGIILKVSRGRKKSFFEQYRIIR